MPTPDFDFSTPQGLLLLGCLSIGAAAAFVKRRMLQEWHLHHWNGDEDTWTWNVAQLLHSPPILMKTYDVTAEYAPLVPHRALVPCAAPLLATPHDAELPREFFERLDGRRRHVTATGRRLPPPKRDAPSAAETIVADYVRVGNWKLGLAAVDHLERRRAAVSVADADCAVLGLLRAGRRHHALSLVTGKYADVPFPPSTFAQMLRGFGAKGEHQLAIQLLTHVESHLRIALDSDAELFSAALSVLSVYDWQQALQLYRSHPAASSDEAARGKKAPPAGTFQALARNIQDAVVTSSNSLLEVETAAKGASETTAELSPLDQLLDDVARRFPAEHSATIAAVLHTGAGGTALRRAFATAAAAVASRKSNGAPTVTGSSSKSSSATRTAAREADDMLALSKSRRPASWREAVALAEACRSPPTALGVVNFLVRHHPSRPGAVARAAASAVDLGAVLKGAARPIHAHGAWEAAAALAVLGISKRACDAVPAFTHTVAVQGHWNLALRLCTQAFSIRRAPPAINELGVCVHASIMAGRWAAALFWIERAHARGMRFRPAVYDAAFAGSGATKWAASLRAYQGMSEVGGTCTEAGVRALLRGQAQQNRAGETLSVLAATNSVRWER